MFSLFLNAFSGETEYLFDRTGNETGLSQATVNTITQDRHGFLWMGTQDGLNRFDGYQFTSFHTNAEDPCAISKNWVRIVYTDKQGTLWVGTRDGGLNRFDETTECFQPFPQQAEQAGSFSEHDVTGLLQDTSGYLWVGTNHGLYRFVLNTGEFDFFQHQPNQSNSLLSNQVDVIFEDRQGILWIATTEGLNRLEPSTRSFQSHRHDPNKPTSISAGPVSAIFEDSQHRFWIGTENGLNQMDRKTGNFISIPLTQADLSASVLPYITSIIEDKQGAIWVSTLREGVFVLKANGIQRLSHQKSNNRSISHNDVRIIFKDRTGVIWIGADGGLSRYNQNSRGFTVITEGIGENYGLSNPWVWSILIDSNGILWVGNDGDGIDRLDRANKEVTNIRLSQNSHRHNRVRCLLQDRAGYYWAGTGEGLERFLPALVKNKWTVKPSPVKAEPGKPAITKNSILRLLEDRNERLWVGTLNGLIRYSKERQHEATYLHDPERPDSLSNNQVQSFLETSKGEIWLGTRDGLNRYLPSEDSFQPFKHNPGNPQSLSHNVIRGMAEDGRERLWIGTYGGGLNLLDRETGRFSHYTERGGLANNVVYAILVAADDSLWMSTNKGLSHFDPQQETFRTYTVDDGLQNQEFNSGSSYQSADGEMFFGGIQGLNSFYPQHIADDPTPPQVLLTRIHINGKPYELPQASSTQSQQPAHLLQKITLEPDHYMASFEFAALHYAAPNRNQYAYKLEGFDPRWQHVSAQRRFASFTNLDAGDYVLLIKGSNKDGVWDTTPARLAIHVKPPIWQTWWANSTYLFLIAALILLYQRRQEAKSRKLERMVEKRTLELKHKNQQLLITQKELVNAAHCAGMAEIASAVLHNAGNVLNTVHTSAYLINDELAKLPTDGIKKVADLLLANQDDLATFLNTDPKGRNIIPYLESLGEKLPRENKLLGGHAATLLEKLHLLSEVLVQQNDYVSSPLHWEKINMEHLLEAALRLLDSRLKQSGLKYLDPIHQPLSCPS